MQATKQEQGESRPKVILEEASKLSICKQERVLDVMRGMLFTRNSLSEKKKEGE